jgi:formiminotetrahydrofolate cyclodeaminase
VVCAAVSEMLWTVPATAGGGSDASVVSCAAGSLVAVVLALLLPAQTPTRERRQHLQARPGVT